MNGPEILEVLDPGLLTTVQDGGRTGLAGEGVTRGGAADRWSLAIANVLVGNPAGAAALELTLAGPKLQALRAVTVGLAGGIGGYVANTGLAVAPGATFTLQAGDTLHLDGPATGARGYLAVPGGIDVPEVLGSRSTALGAGFGGYAGRALTAGDRLCAGAPAGSLTAPPRRWPGDPTPTPGPIRVLPGPDAAYLDTEALDALLATPWSVSSSSDRVGLRLEGPPIAGGPIMELASRGVTAGTVQLPPDRLPIVLLVDHQPTGGYPVIAVTITADVDRLGQLAPGATVHFQATTPEAAREAMEMRRFLFQAGADELREAGRWDDLWLSAH
jgi:5-oxoprolinase (ATP-hydrolysing) subunit C